MTLRGFSSLVAFLIALAGCASAPPSAPIPAFSMAAGSKVGVLVAGHMEWVHAHVGTTIFNNFVAPQPAPWKIEAKAKAYLHADLEAAGFVPVDLDGLGIRASEIDALATSGADGWKENPAQSAPLKRLRSELDLKAVIVIDSRRLLADLECAGGPCSERYMDQSGLFSRSMFNISFYKAVVAVESRVFLLDPSAEVSAVDPLKSAAGIRVKSLRNFKDPADFKTLTADEMQPVVEWVDQYLRQFSLAAASALGKGAN